MRETLQRAQEVYHACARTRDYAHGIETLGALLEEGGDTAQVLHLRASLYTMAGDPVRALEDLDAAVAAGPVWGGLYYDRGALHHGAGNHRRALSDLSGAQYLTLPQMMQYTEQFRSITRAQIELVAGRVSALNECFY